MKTLFTSLTGVIYCVISIKHGLAHLYEKGQGDMCGRCSKFAEEGGGWSRLVCGWIPGWDHLGPAGGSAMGRLGPVAIFSWECNVLCGLKLDLDITHPITRCVFRAVSF